MLPRHIYESGRRPCVRRINSNARETVQPPLIPTTGRHVYTSHAKVRRRLNGRVGFLTRMSFHGTCYRCGQWGHREADCARIEAECTRIEELETALEEAESQSGIKELKAEVRHLRALQKEAAATEARLREREARMREREARMREESSRIQRQLSTQEKLLEEQKIERKQESEHQQKLLDAERAAHLSTLQRAAEHVMYEDRVSLVCNSEGEECETCASKSVLMSSSEFFSGLFSESSGTSSIRAARAAPRESELYSDLAVDTVLELLHAKALEAPRTDGPKKERVKEEKTFMDERGYLVCQEVWVEREVKREVKREITDTPVITLWAPDEELTVDVLVEVCELAAMWLLEDIVPTLARIISNSTDLRGAKEPGELLAVRRLAQNHIEVEGWGEILTAVERELRRFALDPSWSAITLAECSLGEACELIMMQGPATSSEKSDEAPAYEALRRFLEVKDWQRPDASACKTLCSLRSMAALQPSSHVCVATSVLPNGSISCCLTLQSSGPGLDAAPPPSAGPVRDALTLVASVAAEEFARVRPYKIYRHVAKKVLSEEPCPLGTDALLASPQSRSPCATLERLNSCAGSGARPVPKRPSENVLSPELQAEKLSLDAASFVQVLESLPSKHAVNEERVLQAFLAWAAHPRRSLTALELVAPYVRFPLLPSRVILLKDPSFSGLAPLAQRSLVVKGLLAEALRCQQGAGGEQATCGTAWCYHSPLAVGLGGKPLQALSQRSVTSESASEASTQWFRLRARPGRNDCVPKLTVEEMVRLLTNSPASSPLPPSPLSEG